MHSMRIRQVGNGWIVEGDAEDAILVFAEDEATGGVRAFADMLWHISEQFGPPSGRHSEHRIHIEVRPGDKFGDGRE